MADNMPKFLKTLRDSLCKMMIPRRLLEVKGVKNVTVSGDTRFDRVTDIRNAAKEYEVVREFAGDAENVLVVGSSWGTR